MHLKGQAMNISNSMALGAVLGFALSNFAYQAVTGINDWSLAADRSYFQASAVAILMLVGWIASKA